MDTAVTQFWVHVVASVPAVLGVAAPVRLYALPVVLIIYVPSAWTVIGATITPARRFAIDVAIGSPSIRTQFALVVVLKRDAADAPFVAKNAL